MARYLSEEWIAAVHDALSRSAAVREAAVDAAFTLEQRVTGADEVLAYHLAFDHGSVAVGPGPAGAADVTFTQDRATAVAIARGERSVHEAFMAGALKVSGDVGALTSCQPLFQAVDRALDQVRARTDYSLALA